MVGARVIERGGSGRCGPIVIVKSTRHEDAAVSANIEVVRYVAGRRHRRLMATPNNLNAVLRAVTPNLHEGRWVFASFERRPPFDLEIAASIREGSAMSTVIAEQDAERLSLPYEQVWAWIECPSTRAGAVRATGALLAALGRATIACNVITGIGGDHLFVPFDQREDALAVLDELTMDRSRSRPRSDVQRDDGLPVVAIDDGEIRLGQFLKLASLVDSGAAVKPLLAYGRVQVNGEPEPRRGRRLVPGDVVTLDGRSVAVG
jgi:ribosome-associated protein YbcJ (S4-like RNA binding protein)